MIKLNPNAFSVLVWHKNDVEGKHQHIITNGSTAERALSEFSRYLVRPWSMRSFTPSHVVQLHGPNGFICDLPNLETEQCIHE